MEEIYRAGSQRALEILSSPNKTSSESFKQFLLDNPLIFRHVTRFVMSHIKEDNSKVYSALSAVCCLKSLLEVSFKLGSNFVELLIRMAVCEESVLSNCADPRREDNGRKSQMEQAICGLMSSLDWKHQILVCILIIQLPLMEYMNIRFYVRKVPRRRLYLLVAVD